MTRPSLGLERRGPHSVAYRLDCSRNGYATLLRHYYPFPLFLCVEFSSFKFEKSNPIEIELIIEIELAIHAI